MSLFSGTDIQDVYGSPMVQMIAGSVSDAAIISMLSKAQGFRIGQLRYTTNLSHTPQGDLVYENQIPENFNGWVYPNGKKIGKTLFPEMYDLLSTLSYDGKVMTATSITLPVIDTFFKMNANKSTPLAKGSAKYSMPDHKHSLGDPTATTITQTVKQCAYIWSTPVDTSATGGKIGAMKWPVDGTKTWTGIQQKDIPEGPSAHCGSNAAMKINGKYAWRTWDVPIDTLYNGQDQKITLNCDTDYTGDLSQECWPKHVVMPIQIYIGAPH